MSVFRDWETRCHEADRLKAEAMTVEVIDHEMPTGEQMRQRVRDKIAAGERLGASHNGEFGGVSYLGSTTSGRWDYCPGTLTKRGNPK